ncbi:MAG: transketolase family protein [Clostridiales bacterium]|nr:transketolase family protein [Clostridiales bacterium]
MKISNQRTVYGETLVELGAEDERIVVLEADLGKSTQSYAFSQKYPERYFEMGIAEANMTSFAAGLSLMGKVAFTNSFAVFATGRAYDQIRQGIATANLNVKIVGSSAGFSDFGDGATHQSVEDIAIMRAIPNMTVLVPADAPQLKAMVKWMVDYHGPVYLRVSRNDIPEVTGENPDPIDPAILREGSDVAAVTCGIMGGKALEAAEMLAKEGISLRVINVPCIKPFPQEEVKELTKGVKAIITCEEHSIIGGLSQATAWALRGDGRPIQAVAAQDVFGQSAANPEELLEYYHLTAKDIATKAKEVLGGK